MAKSYRSQYLDPRWQKKRLEVFQANDFLCGVCHNGERTLHVHHKQYIANRDVWDYEIEQLACLCETCHKVVHESTDLLNEIISRLPDEPTFRNETAFLIAGFQSIKVSLPEDNPNAKLVYEIGQSARQFFYATWNFYMNQEEGKAK